mgnify:CR=1 FL=1
MDAIQLLNTQCQTYPFSTVGLPTTNNISYMLFVLIVNVFLVSLAVIEYVLMFMCAILFAVGMILFLDSDVEVWESDSLLTFMRLWS